MRIERLDLLAFGPFTDVTLDLSEGDSLQVIYGDNEAGKSSSLRALSAWLFGIHPRTNDDFRHPKKKLRVGGRLRGSGGQTLSFVRRKGRKNTLLRPEDGEPLPDDALSPLLAGVDQALFSQLYGIDHARLVQGGEALLSQSGDVGQALFSAATGTAHLRELLADLQGRAQALFRPTGKNPRVNRALSRWREARKAVTQTALSSRVWQQLRQELEQTRQDIATVETEAARLEGEQARLTRQRRVLTPLAERRRLQARLAEIEGQPRLSPDFGEQHREAEARQRQGEELLQRIEARLERNAQQRAALQIRQELLDHEETITSLFKRIDTVETAQRDRQGQDAIRRDQRNAAARTLQQIRPDLSLEAAETLRPLLNRQPWLNRLAHERGLLSQRAEQTGQERRAVASRREALQKRREALPPAEAEPPGLEATLAAARKAGDLDERAAQAAHHAAREHAGCEADLARLGRYAGSLARLAAAAFPAGETLDAFERTFDDREAQARDRQRVRDELRRERQEAEQELKALLAAQEVPSLEALQRARRLRDAGWQLVKRRYIDVESPAAGDEETGDGEPAANDPSGDDLTAANDPSGDDLTAANDPSSDDLTAANDPSGDDLAATYPPGADLPAAYEGRVTEADDLADRLRLAADQVQQRAQLEAKLGRLAKREVHLATESEQHARQAARVQQDWEAAWADTGVTPGTPREMRSWLLEADRLRSRLDTARAAAAEARRLGASQRALYAALQEALQAAGESDLPAPPAPIALPLADPGDIPPAASASNPRDSAAAASGPAADSGASPMTTDEAHPAGPVATLRERAERSLAALQERAAERQRLAQDQAQLEQQKARLREQEQRLAEQEQRWRDEWAEALDGLGLDSDARPDQALAVAEQLSLFFEQADRSDQAARRIYGMDEVARDFTERVRELADRVGDAPAQQEAIALAGQLHRDLQQTREAQARLSRLQDEQQELEAEAEQARLDVEAARERLARLRAQAGVQTDEALPEAHRRARERDELEQRLARLEQDLLLAGDGLDLSALEQEAAQVDPDALDPRLEQLDAQLADLRARRDERRDRQRSLQDQVNAQDGRSAAAAASEEAEQHLADVVDGAEAYLRLRIASLLLDQQIRRYRQENQAPLLQRAGALFSGLTLGSFVGLRDELDDQRRPILLGVRPDGDEVRLAGMSEGTRDQLYLALRLATLEQQLTRPGAEPMPFIADDVLIGFDDDRTRAGLQALAALANHTQVLLFTHHRRVADLSADLPPPHAARVLSL